MQIVINIDKKDYEFIKSVRSIMKNRDTFQRIATDLFKAVQEAEVGDLISRDALKKHIFTVYQGNGVELEPIEVVSVAEIDNAPTVCGNNPQWCESCVSKGKCASTRTQGDKKGGVENDI